MSQLRQLGRQDVMFVGGETHNTYQHTAGLVLLDSQDRPDFNFESFRKHAIDRISLIPHFRWKLHEVPLGFDRPYWVEDDKFSFDYHIKRIAVPSPGDREALGEVVAHLYSKHLDRSRSLWEIWFIEGLQGGKFAFLQKLHHCMMDGEGAAKLAETLCDFEPDAGPKEADPDITNAQPGATPTSWQRSINAALHLSRLPGEAARGIVDAMRPKLRQRLAGGREPGRRRPVTPAAPFNAEVGRDRGFVFGSVPLDPIKVVKNHFDVTVNDVVLALVSGSLREYLLKQGSLPNEALRTLIAVSLRTEEDDELSNKATITPVTLATNLADPAERLRAINAETGAAKGTAKAGGTSVVEIMQMMPPLLVNAAMRLMRPEQALRFGHANLTVSSVRGSDRPMYFGGVRLATIYPMSILTTGMGLNITCLSYGGKVDFGVAIDPELIPDPWTIIEGLHGTLEQYLSLVGKKNGAT